jgi:shikimate dehydrogenase
VASPNAYAVIGDPVAHSLSPRLFAWMFRELEVDARYEARRVGAEGLKDVLQAVKRGELRGLSVTLPHKEAVIPLLDAVDPLAARIGAVNCVAREEGGTLRGYNTDAEGLAFALEDGGGLLLGAEVLLLGAGGAARAAAFACLSNGASVLTLANRSEARAVKLARELVEAERLAIDGAATVGQKAFISTAPLTAEALGRPLAQSTIVINATSVGLDAPSEDPLPAGLALGPRHTVLDMVYRPLRTALLQRAEAQGARTVDGLWMLVHQALEQLRLWTGVRPSNERAFASRAHQHLT